MKELDGRKKTNLIANVGFGVMLLAVLVITSVAFEDGTTAIRVTLAALGVCLFLSGMFLTPIAFIYRKYAQTIKELRYNDYLSDERFNALIEEIRECHNLEDNQA